MLDFLITLLLFSSMEVISKPLMGSIDSESLTVARFIVGFLVVLFFSILRKEIGALFKLPKKTIILVALAGFLNTFFSMTMLQKAVEFGSPATAALVFCTNPVFVLLIQVVRKQETTSLRTILGMCAALSGIVLVISRNGIALSDGVFYALAASVSFATFTVLNKSITKTVSPINSNVGAFFFGILCSIIYILIAGKTFCVTPLFVTTSRVITFLYLGIGVSGIAYITFIRTIRKLSPLSSSVIFLLKPAVAALLSMAFIKEVHSLTFLLGLFLVFSGSIIVLWEKLHSKSNA